MDKPLFSIIIPLYNKEKAISRTINSVQNQTVQDFELIIIDDGSTDNSFQVVKSISDTDSRIILIHKDNGGVSSARNVGIKNAKSEYIALLDGDDLWEPSFLEEQLKLIKDFSKAAIWGVNYAFIKGNKTTPCYQGLPEGYRDYVNNYFGTSHNDLFCSSSVVVRKSAFENIGYYDERISSSEDLDVWYRIILKYPVVYYDKVLAYYNQNAENRVAYDTDIRFPLHKCISFYIHKYTNYFKSNPSFAKFFCTLVANDLLRNGYYFGSRQERLESDEVIKHLQFDAIHPKYKFIFKTPRFIGWIIYKIVCIKKSIKH